MPFPFSPSHLSLATGRDSVLSQGGLCSGSAFRSAAHRGNWPAWLHTRSSLDCCHSRRLALRDKKMFPCTSKPLTLGLKFWFHSSARICCGLGAALQIVLTLVCNPSDSIGAVHIWAVQTHPQQKLICPCLP